MATPTMRLPRGEPFRAFTAKASGLINRIITPVQITKAFDPQTPPEPIPASLQSNALWDTGATGSNITPSVASQLALVPTGSVIVNHAGGSEARNTYLINLYLPNRVAIAGVRVAECAETPQFGVIIGMDVIVQGDFAVTNFRGQTWVSFRMPSMQAVDYVEEVKQIVFSGTKRNDPCPCGKKDANGKAIKFKRCHGLPSLS